MENNLNGNQQEPTQEQESQKLLEGFNYDTFIEKLREDGIIPKVGEAGQGSLAEILKTVLEHTKQTPTKTDDNLSLGMLVQALRNKDNKHDEPQSHGLTQGEMKEVQKLQRSGQVPMMKANKSSRHEIPVHEKHLMHFTTERLFYNSADGSKLSRPRWHVMRVEEFNRMSRTTKVKGEKVNPENAFSGMKVTIYHDPRVEEGKGQATKRSEKSLEEMLEEMDEMQLREKYEDVFGEPALPSDSVKVLRSFILEKALEPKE